MEKCCTLCGEVKPLVAFFADVRASDGKRSRCKVCERHRQRNSEKAREFNRAYNVRHRDRRMESNRRYRLAHPGKGTGRTQAAHRIVQNAVRAGLLVVPWICEQCGANERLDAHHDDYSKPLEVRWLCRPCHAKHHVEVAA